MDTLFEIKVKLTSNLFNYVAPNQVKDSLRLSPPPKPGLGGLVFSKNILIYVLDDFHSFFLRKLEGKTHLLDTLNICVGLMKNFLETFEKKFRAKNEDFHRIFESDLDAKFWMLKKTHESLISVLRIGLVCRTFLIFLRLQRAESSASFKYLDHDRATSRKFFRSG